MEYILAVDEVRTEAFEIGRLCFEIEKVIAEYVRGVCDVVEGGDEGLQRRLQYIPPSRSATTLLQAAQPCFAGRAHRRHRPVLVGVTGCFRSGIGPRLQNKFALEPLIQRKTSYQ